MKSRTALRHLQVVRIFRQRVSADDPLLMKLVTSRCVERSQICQDRHSVSTCPGAPRRLRHSGCRLAVKNPDRSILAHGRKSAPLRSAQFSFAFLPLAEGRDPSTPVPDTVPHRTRTTPSTHPSFPAPVTRPASTTDQVPDLSLLQSKTPPPVSNPAPVQSPSHPTPSTRP